VRSVPSTVRLMEVEERKKEERNLGEARSRIYTCPAPEIALVTITASKWGRDRTPRTFPLPRID